MPAQDPEDGLDQILERAWTGLAQQINVLHQGLRNEHEHAKAEQARREAREESVERERRLRLSQLESWENENRERLNTGFEHVLDSTVLSDKGCKDMDDTRLLKAWVVARQLDGNDPGYVTRLNEAKMRINDEWTSRHPGQRIDAAADRLTNHVTITYCDRSVDLDKTIAAFRKAGQEITPVRAEDPAAFRREHGGATFSVDTRLSGSWSGYQHDRIIDAILQSPVSDMGEADARIGWLKDHDLPESSHADNKAVGDEPSSVDETERDENQDAAPTPVPDAGRGTTAEPAVPDTARVVQAAEIVVGSQFATDMLLMRRMRIGSDEAGRILDELEKQGVVGRPDPAKPGSRPVAIDVNGLPAAVSRICGEDPNEPLDLDEPEPWEGPDPFGELSPTQEASQGAAPLTPTAGAAGEKPTLDKPEHTPKLSH